jgi:transcriptional regulator with XRE-family HTH domain
MVAERFAARLRELRIAAGLSQQELAGKVGLTVRQISRLETGVRDASWPTILALCAALGVDCTAFTEAPAAEAPAPSRGRPKKGSRGRGDSKQ